MPIPARACLIMAGLALAACTPGVSRPLRDRPFPFPIVGQGTPIAGRWDFEQGTAGAWEAVDPMRYQDATEADRNVWLEPDPLRGGTCLAIRDASPERSPFVRLEVVGLNPAKTYVVRGLLRAPAALPAHQALRLSVAGVDGKFLRWMPLPPLAVGTAWTPFTVTVTGLPPEAAWMELSLRPTADQAKTALGQLWADDLELHEQDGPRAVVANRGGEKGLPVPPAPGPAPALVPLVASAPWSRDLVLSGRFTAVDLSEAANRGFADTVVGDGKGGWTDQGDNDLRGMPSGLIEVGGVPFVVLDAAANAGRSAVILRRGGAPAFAETVRIPVARRASRICLLHASAWSSTDTQIGTLRLVHEDGTSTTLPMICGQQVCDWWGGRAQRAHLRPLAGVNPRHSPVHLAVASFANPKPGQAIRELVLEAAPTAGNITWMVVAATVAEGDDPVLATAWENGRQLTPAETAGLLTPEMVDAPELPLRLEPGPSLALRVDVDTTLRPTPRAVAGISFHRVLGYGTGAYSLPYHRAFPHPLTLPPPLEQRLRDLQVPMTRFYGVGAEPIPVEESIDRIAALLDRLGIPQETCVLELEEQSANEALPPATWARAVRHARSSGYRFHRWEIGNEVYCGGLWQSGGRAFPTPEAYVAHAMAVAAAVRAEQPEALIGVSYFDGSTRWGSAVLKALAGHYDFAVAHWYQFAVHERDFEATVIDENHWTLDRILSFNALLRAYNPGRSVHQYDTEWGLHARAGQNYHGGGIPPGKVVAAYRPNGNIIGVVQRAVRLIYYLREGVVDGAGLWGMTGLADHPAFTVNPVDAKDGQQSMVYELYRQLAKVSEDRVVGLSGRAPFRTLGKALRGTLGHAVPLTPAVAMASADGKRLTLVIANGSWTASFPAEVAITGLAATAATGVVLSHDDADGDPMIGRADEVLAALPVSLVDGTLRFTLPPHAVVFLSVQ